MGRIHVPVRDFRAGCIRGRPAGRIMNTESNVSTDITIPGLIASWTVIWSVFNWGTVWGLAASQDPPYELLAKGIAVIFGVAGVISIIVLIIITVIFLFFVFLFLDGLYRRVFGG